VVVVLAEVAVAAGLGLGRAHRMREVRGERLAGEADRTDRRLLDIDPLAVDVGRAQHQRARRANRRYLVAFGGLVLAELEHFVARDLRVVRREVPGRFTIVAMDAALPVGFDRQVAAAATRGPREVAGEARHLLFAVRAVCNGDAGAELELAAIGARLAHQLGAGSFGVEVRAGGVDAVLDETVLPFELGIDDRALGQYLAAHAVVAPL